MLNAAKAVITGRKERVRAVEDVSFQVKSGEIIGLLGPNGAGKTTILKMLSGILHPTDGAAEVSGHTPWKREQGYLRSISMVTGQRSQLHWDLPALDSYELKRVIYKINRKTFNERLAHLTDLLSLEGLIRKPVRNLSLGERMKCELAGALLHHPRVLFLDEPTIGLDLETQQTMRDFVREYNRSVGATIVLTSHYMADVTALCSRVILIHSGQVAFDGELDVLQREYGGRRTIRLRIGAASPAERSVLNRLGAVAGPEVDIEGAASRGGGDWYVSVPRDTVPQVAHELLKSLHIDDMAIQEPSTEEIIQAALREPHPISSGAARRSA